MKPRVRVLAALLALFAFSASTAEQVWACAPMDAAARSSAIHHAAMPMPGHDAQAAHHPAAPHHPKAPADAPRDGCPLAAVQACAVPAIPAAAPRADVSPAHACTATPAPRADVGRLLVVSLFRPPIG